jgi:hypothetical protein
MGAVRYVLRPTLSQTYENTYVQNASTDHVDGDHAAYAGL